MPQKSALLLLANGFEELEAVAPIDILRRAGVSVNIASVDGAPLVRGRCGLAIQADGPVPDLATLPQGYDLLVLPGGPAVPALRKQPVIIEIIRKFAAAGLPIGAICAAPLLLKDAGLLDGRRHTAHDSVWDELPGAIGGERVVQDGNLITSRGAGTAVDFALALVARITSSASSGQVAKDIMV
ncbi:MAG: DJ-1/PfpI family protein [Puniceicoccales bacterium]|jgi:4-methyl-5(b-hydroxyethyl)-thiazole monophosphate biosynthesis|nr:DJ-1/PfpI family protein [Puniceicoccales bacterium]